MENTDKRPGSKRQVLHLQHWLIAAVLLSTLYSSVQAAEPLVESDATASGEFSERAQQFLQRSPQGAPMAAQRDLASDWEDSGPAGAGRIHGKGAGAGPVWRGAILALHAVQPFKGTEIGVELSMDAAAMDWYGVYLKSLDRVAEPNSIYGLLRETQSFGGKDSKGPFALCCGNRGTMSSLDQHENPITRLELSPTFLVFGLLRNQGYAFKLTDGWKLQVGVRHLQYDSTHQTRFAFFTVERSWESIRTSYSYQVERAGGTLAPSHVLQLDYLYSPRNSIGVSFANGHEFADFGTLGILDAEVRNVSIRGQHLFKDDWALTFQAGYNNHGSLPAQKGLRIGVRYSF